MSRRTRSSSLGNLGSFFAVARVSTSRRFARLLPITERLRSLASIIRRMWGGSRHAYPCCCGSLGSH